MIFMLKGAHVWFPAAGFNIFNCESDKVHLLWCLQPFIHSHKTFAAPLSNPKTVSFEFLRIVYSLIYVSLAYHATSWNTICWITLWSESKHLVV